MPTGCTCRIWSTGGKARRQALAESGEARASPNPGPAPDQGTRARSAPQERSAGRDGGRCSNWDGQCAVTGFTIRSALIASHAKPWTDCNDEGASGPMQCSAAHGHTRQALRQISNRVRIACKIAWCARKQQAKMLAASARPVSVVSASRGRALLLA